jgi:hypothetical protein
MEHTLVWQGVKQSADIKYTHTQLSARFTQPRVASTPFKTAWGSQPKNRLLHKWPHILSTVSALWSRSVERHFTEARRNSYDRYLQLLIGSKA